MPAAGQFYFGDADSVSFTGGGISTTTAATAVAALVLGQDRRILSIVNGSNGIVFVARKSVRAAAAAAPVAMDMVPAGLISKWDLWTNQFGMQRGDTIYLYAASAPTGNVFISAL